MDRGKWRYTLRAEYVLFQKIQYIAGREMRSVNKEIEHCLKKYVAAYEKENGEIPLN